MGKVKKGPRGRWFVANTHNGAMTGKGFKTRHAAAEHLKELRRRARRKS